jgi:hypothetical protein
VRLANAILPGLLIVFAYVLLHVPTERVPLYYDMLGYTSQASSLLAGEGNTITVGDEQLPGIYPAGLPALLTVPMRVLGPDVRHGLWVILGAALLAISLVFSIARRFGGTAAGLIAAMLLLSSAMYREFSGSIMTQVPAGTVGLLVVWLWLRRGSATATFLAGLVAVLSLLLRFANLPLPLALLLAECLAGGLHSRARRRSLKLLVAGMGAGALVLLAHNAWAFGHPFTSGYALWNLDVQRFSLGNLFAPEGAPLRQESWVLLRAFTGLSALQSVPFVLLSWFGLRVCWRDGKRDESLRRLVVVSVTVIGIQYAFLAAFYYRSESYLLTSLPLAAVLAGVGLARVLSERRTLWAAVCVAGLLGFGVARTPEPEKAAASVQRQAGLIAASAALEADSVLITTGDPGLIEPFFRAQGQRSVLYLGPHVSPLIARAVEAELGGDPSSVERIVDYALERARAGRPVYLDQNPPPRTLHPFHVEALKALRSTFRLDPAGADNYFRLVPRVASGG